MKRIVLTLLAATLLLTGASAQETERVDRMKLMSADSLTRDSLYTFWNTYVQLHPKDEVAWRNLFDVSEENVMQLGWKSWGAAKRLRRKLNVVGRMKEAIPGTYTFYLCAFEGYYTSEEKLRKMEEFNGGEFHYIRKEEYADSAIATLPDNVSAYDYEGWIQYLIHKCDSVRLNYLLTRYYESGQYPQEDLQYHFNELQGMDESGVYIGAHEGDVIGKLILQQVLGVHRDKILYDENAAHNQNYVKHVFAQIGIPYSEDVLDRLHTMWQSKTLIAFMQYIVEHSKRPVYLSAHSMSSLILGEGLPDELKACFYNEGLTMRYSTKPYDNMSVKRRNIENRYRMEYLRMPFHPENKIDMRRFSNSAKRYASNYMHLLHDQLPYYKKHDKERYQWLRDIYMDIIAQMRKKNVDVGEINHYLEYLK